MLLVRTYVAPSPIHGLGLFAAEPIAAGTPMWRFQSGFDQILAPELVEQLPAVAHDFIMIYAYLSPDFPGGYVLNGDQAIYINHSKSPNTDNAGPVTLAAHDIAAGEEITCDYDVCCLEHELQVMT